MRPRERQETGEQDLLRSRLDRIIDLTHALVKLSRANRGNRSVLHRPRRQRAGAGLRLLRGRARATGDSQAADP